MWSLSEAVYQHPVLIDRLYGFLERPAPLNPALAAHVSKVAGSLLEKKPAATLSYLRERPNMVEHFVRHLSSSAVMDLLLKIISCDEEGGGTLEWLCADGLIGLLVAKFGPDHSADVHEHAAHALADIIQVAFRIIESVLFFCLFLRLRFILLSSSLSSPSGNYCAFQCFFLFLFFLFSFR